METGGVVCACQGGGGGGGGGGRTEKTWNRVRAGMKVRRGDRIGRRVGMGVDRTTVNPSNPATPSSSRSILITG